MITKKSARAKGNNFEIQIANLMTEISGVKYRRVPLSGGLHQDLPFDVMKIGYDQSVFDGIGNECKNHKKVRVPEWIEQIKIACDDANLKFNPKWFIAFNCKGKTYFIINENLFREVFTALKRSKLSTG